MAATTKLLARGAPIWCWAGLFVLCAGGLGACTHSPQSRLDAAVDQMCREDFVGAQKTLRQLLRQLDRQRPLNAAGAATRRSALSRLGAINALYLRDFPQALADYSLLVRGYPQSEAARAALGAMADIYQHRQAKLFEAIAAYEQLLQRFADSPEAPAAQLAIVHIYFKLKDYVRARQQAGRIVQAWPKSPEAVRAGLEIADAYFQERQFTQAVATYEALLTDKPATELATLMRFELGNCYQELGEPQRALDAYYSALPDHPNPALVQRKIARVRSRIYNLAPSDGILNAPPVSRRMLAVQHRRNAQMGQGP